MTKEEMQALMDMFDERLDKKFDEKLAPIQKDITELKTDVGKIEVIQKDITELKTGQTKIEVIIENQVNRAIKTIAEGHSSINRKLDEKIALEDRVETVENRVSAVEYVLKKAE